MSSDAKADAIPQELMDEARKGADGMLWARPVEEFNDGRFAPLHAEGE